jgi:hypothetical protein
LQNSATFGIGRNPYCGGHRTGYLNCYRGKSVVALEFQHGFPLALQVAHPHFSYVYGSFKSITPIIAGSVLSGWQGVIEQYSSPVGP